MTAPRRLTDAEWQKIRSLLPKARGTGRPRTHSLREVLHFAQNDTLLRPPCQSPAFRRAHFSVNSTIPFQSPGGIFIRRFAMCAR